MVQSLQLMYSQIAMLDSVERTIWPSAFHLPEKFFFLSTYCACLNRASTAAHMPGACHDRHNMYRSGGLINQHGCSADSQLLKANFLHYWAHTYVRVCQLNVDQIRFYPVAARVVIKLWMHTDAVIMAFLPGELASALISLHIRSCSQSQFDQS